MSSSALKSKKGKTRYISSSQRQFDLSLFSCLLIVSELCVGQRSVKKKGLYSLPPVVAGFFITCDRAAALYAKVSNFSLNVYGLNTKSKYCLTNKRGCMKDKLNYKLYWKLPKVLDPLLMGLQQPQKAGLDHRECLT